MEEKIIEEKVVEEKISEEKISEEKMIKQGDMKYYILETIIFVIVSSITWFLSR